MLLLRFSGRENCDTSAFFVHRPDETRTGSDPHQIVLACLGLV
jgi:hypothetical protein